MGLPTERRLRRSADVTRVVKHGRRVRSGSLLLHHLSAGPTTEPIVRVAFAAPRSVGSAVLRNRTRRRLQAQVVALLADDAIARDVDLVIRLLPGSVAHGYEQLGSDLRKALSRAGVMVGG